MRKNTPPQRGGRIGMGLKQPSKIGGGLSTLKERLPKLTEKVQHEDKIESAVLKNTYNNQIEKIEQPQGA